jgi:L-fucose mutarotase/ribose pyranase (RbsD/FucU family)
MKLRNWVMMIVAGTAMICGSLRADDASPWRHVLQEKLSVFGAGNMIVVADAAYPAQSSDGVEIIKAEGSQLEIVKAIADELSYSKLLNADPMTTSELASISEQDAPGISNYRASIGQLFAGQEVKTAALADLIAKVDKTSRTLKVLVIKTTSPLPYSAVFFHLTSANWSAAAEKRLRDSAAAGK